MGLVDYPTTSAPATVTTQCADNARRTSSSLNVLCNSDGSWSGNPRCGCNSGYQVATVNGRQICQSKTETIAIEMLKCTLFIPLADVDCPVVICEARIEGLVRYNATLAPLRGSMAVTTQCADNAKHSSSSPNALCNSDGFWIGNPRCECNDGYRMATEDGRQICESKLHTKNNVYVSYLQ